MSRATTPRAWKSSRNEASLPWCRLDELWNSRTWYSAWNGSGLRDGVVRCTKYEGDASADGSSSIRTCEMREARA